MSRLDQVGDVNRQVHLAAVAPDVTQGGSMTARIHVASEASNLVAIGCAQLAQKRGTREFLFETGFPLSFLTPLAHHHGDLLKSSGLPRSWSQSVSVRQGDTTISR